MWVHTAFSSTAMISTSWFLSHGAWKAPVLTPATSKPATFFGIMRFYCLGSRGSGAALMAAAVGNHREALYSLAVIQFNGSGGSKDDRAPPRRWPTAHVDALRELGHCLQQGYGLRRSVLDRRRLLIQANARELAAVVTAASASLLRAGAGGATSKGGARGHSCLLSDFGCRAAAAAGETHAANRFLVDWFASRPPPPREPGPPRRTRRPASAAVAGGRRRGG
ncbi:hypothetical protein ACP70R_023180 [Stipagrostis hirtigluma subsp. patula]